MRLGMGIGTWVAAWILVISLASALTQAPVDVKTWTFTLSHGTLEFNLRAYPDGRTNLGIGPSREGCMAPVAEHVEPLERVLAEMSALGYDPRRLSYLDTRTFGDDETFALAYACADSEAWRLSMRNKGKEKQRIAVAVLNESGIYEPYNKAFKEYGIRMRVTEVEIMGLMRFSYVPPRNDRDRKNARLLVPAHTYIGMRFSPIYAPPERKKQ